MENNLKITYEYLQQLELEYENIVNLYYIIITRLLDQ